MLSAFTLIFGSFILIHEQKISVECECLNSSQKRIRKWTCIKHMEFARICLYIYSFYSISWISMNSILLSIRSVLIPWAQIARTRNSSSTLDVAKVWDVGMLPYAHDFFIATSVSTFDREICSFSFRSRYRHSQEQKKLNHAEGASTENLSTFHHWQRPFLDSTFWNIPRTAVEIGIFDTRNRKFSKPFQPAWYILHNFVLAPNDVMLHHLHNLSIFHSCK